MGKDIPVAEEMNQSQARYPELFGRIDPAAVPRHVGIIMDGNGRWASRRAFPRIRGHREGVHSVDEVVACAREVGVRVLTLYAFSVENWRRPKMEIQALMSLLREYIVKKLPVMHQHGIRFKTIGRTEDLSPNTRKLLRRAEQETAGYGGLVLNLALSYGGRTEIVDAVRSLVRDAADGKLHPDHVDEALLSARMYTAGLPDPDLIIRTSGEHRTSNFLLWQAAYTELYFTPTFWPDFKRREFLEAILDFQGRERRFGLIGEQLKPTKRVDDAL